MILEGQISLTAYFVDLTRKKQVAVSLIFALEVMTADFILVGPLFPPTVAWWLKPEISCIACITYGSHIGGSVSSPL